MKEVKLTLVPMKENSTRVPDKNIRDLNGKPVCHWIIETLSKSKYIDEIIINTDSEKIVNLVSNFDKVKVINRPKHLLGDEISIQPLIAHDIEFAKNELILQTHSTNPLLKHITIDDAIEKFIKNSKQYDALFSVTPFQQRFYYKDITPINHNPKNLIQTQLLEPIYHENSCIYIFSRETNRKVKTGKNPMIYEMEHLESVDIDEMHDFLWAEFLISKMK